MAVPPDDTCRYEAVKRYPGFGRHCSISDFIVSIHGYNISDGLCVGITDRDAADSRLNITLKPTF